MVHVNSGNAKILLHFKSKYIVFEENVKTFPSYFFE